VDGLLKQASFYWSWGTTPTEDAKASSVFFYTVDFTGAYGVSHFSSNTLRVLACAVTPELVDFVRLHPAGAVAGSPLRPLNGSQKNAKNRLFMT